MSTDVEIFGLECILCEPAQSQNVAASAAHQARRQTGRQFASPPSSSSRDAALLVAALEFPVNPRELVSELLAGGVDGLSERLLRRALSVWTSEHGGGTMVGLIRAAASHDEAARMMKEFFAREVLGRVVKSLGMPQSELRAALVASQMVGLAMARFVIRFEPIATASIDEMVSWYAPTLQRYLTGPLAGDTARTRRPSATPAGPARRPRKQPPSRSPSAVAPNPPRARMERRGG